MSAGFPRRTAIGVLAALIIAAAGTSAGAATLPGMVKALPNPPGAPQLNVFLVTVPQLTIVPTKAVLRFTPRLGKAVILSLPLKHPDKYQYELFWKASQEGRVLVSIYTAHHQLVAQDAYPVTKSHDKPTGRIIVGTIFIGGSLWFWWRQRRMLNNHR